MLVLFGSWESSAKDGVLGVLLIIELTTYLGKSFHKANLLIVLILEDNLSVEHIRDARVTKPLTNEVQCGLCREFVNSTYRPVSSPFKKIVIP